jgi:S-adenosylmethionine decarboxylase
MLGSFAGRPIQPRRQRSHLDTSGPLVDDELVDGEYAELRKLEATTRKTLFTVDATARDVPALSDVNALVKMATAAVDHGNGHVLRTSSVRFPNGAVTCVLILAESHLSFHTWPEEDLVAIDLFGCGAIDAEAVVARLVADLGLTDVTVRRLERGRDG